jgi:hypothetical protein
MSSQPAPFLYTFHNPWRRVSHGGGPSISSHLLLVATEYEMVHRVVYYVCDHGWTAATLIRLSKYTAGEELLSDSFDGLVPADLLGMASFGYATGSIGSIMLLPLVRSGPARSLRLIQIERIGAQRRLTVLDKA